MEIIEYKENEKSYIKDGIVDEKFTELLKTCKERDSLDVCFSTLLEEGVDPFRLIKIIEFDKKGEEDILSNESTFKHACAFSSYHLIEYLYPKIKNINIQKAVDACILNHNLNNLLTLEFLHKKSTIYKEDGLVLAINRVSQGKTNLNLVNHFLKKIDVFKDSSKTTRKLLCEQNWYHSLSLDKTKDNHNHNKLFEVLIDLKSKNFKDKLIEDSCGIMGTVLSDGDTSIIDKIMTSTIAEDFVKAYRSEDIEDERMSIIKECLSLTKGDQHWQKGYKATKYIVETYPELLEHKEIKLSMINTRSKDIKEFIEEKRVIENGEIIEAFIRIAGDFDQFRELQDLFPNIDYKMFNISDGVEIMNKIYDTAIYEEVGYNLDGEYMELAIKLILENKPFRENTKEIEKTLNDKNLYNLLNKISLRNSLEDSLPTDLKSTIKKPSSKRAKI